MHHCTDVEKSGAAPCSCQMFRHIPLFFCGDKKAGGHRLHRFVVAQLCTWGAQGGKLELEHMSRFLHIEGGVSAFGGIISIRMQTQQKCDKACAKHLSTMQQHIEIKVIQS